MTREGKIRNLVAELITYTDSRVVTMLQEAAVFGMTWADAHPKNPWRDAGKLPPINQDTAESDFVFVRVENATTGEEWTERPAKYNVHIKDWIAMDFTHIGKRGGKVTHWMPIPELSKGGEK